MVIKYLCTWTGPKWGVLRIREVWGLGIPELLSAQWKPELVGQMQGLREPGVLGACLSLL